MSSNSQVPSVLWYGPQNPEAVSDDFLKQMGCAFTILAVGSLILISIAAVSAFFPL